MILINPKSNNPYAERAIEPPIWCALMAKDDDTILDFDVNEDVCISPESYSDVLIVAMGSNPSASSTSKMPEVYRLKERMPECKITGLHPMAMGEADIPLPSPLELIKIKRAKWEKLDMKLYRAHSWHCLQDINNRGGYASLYTSYGCPFKCSFCNIHTLYGGRTVYFRKPYDVGSEIGYLVKEHRIRNLKFCDEIFTINHRHVSEICELIKDYKLNIWAYGKVGTVNPGILKKMKQAGINWLAYGFESGNKYVLNNVKKTYGNIFETVKMTRDAGINIMGNFIFGLPGETPGTMAETLDFAMNVKCDFVNFYTAKNYPGSELYDGNTDWKEYDQYNQSSNFVKNFRDHAFKKYFSEPGYLKMIKSKFGNQAYENIKRML